LLVTLAVGKLAAIAMSLALAACSGVPDVHYSDPATTTSPTEPSGDQDQGSAAPQGGSPAGSTPSSPATGSGTGGAACMPAASIEPNHNGAPHGLGLPVADFASATTGDRTYELTTGGSGGSAHTHAFVVTAAQRAAIANRGEVTVETSPGGSSAHTHQVTLRCP
jgi:hypothetical protein